MDTVSPEPLEYTPLPEHAIDCFAAEQHAARLHHIEGELSLALGALQRARDCIREEMRTRVAQEQEGDVVDMPPLPPPPPYCEEYAPCDESSAVPPEDVLHNERRTEFAEKKTHPFRAVFLGDSVRTEHGQELPIAANYASKSRLVQGDVLIVRMTADGRHVFKQIGPVKRRRTSGILEYDQFSRKYYVRCPEGRLCVLDVSITYFRGAPGDTVQCLIPARKTAQWGAVERIIKQT